MLLRWSTDTAASENATSPANDYGSAKPFWVHDVDGIIPDISIEIYISATEFYWIFADKSLQHRVEISCPVVIKLRSIIFPPRVLERIAITHTSHRGFPKWLVCVFGLDGTSGIREG
jgi:hypothetical protein